MTALFMRRRPFSCSPLLRGRRDWCMGEVGWIGWECWLRPSPWLCCAASPDGGWRARESPKGWGHQAACALIRELIVANIVLFCLEQKRWLTARAS